MKETEYDTENVTVQIVELSPDDIAKSNNWIGSNKPVYETVGKSKAKSGKVSNGNVVDGVHEDAAEDGEGEEADNDDDEQEQVPGFAVTKAKKRPKTTNDDEVDDENETSDNEKPKRRRKNLPESFSSKREIGQVLAKNVQNKLRQSKAFRTKAKLEKVRSKKKARIEKEKKLKVQKKREKFKKTPTKAGKEKPKTFHKKGRGRK